MIMLQVSYVAAAVSMICAATYLVVRLRPFVTTTTMLIGSLLLVYGPAVLSYTLASGEKAYPLRRLLGMPLGPANVVWAAMTEQIKDFDAVISAMNLSVALMYAGIILGIEIATRTMPARAATLDAALCDWRQQDLRDDAGDCRILLGVITSLAIFMLCVSFQEHHLATIKDFFSASAETGDRNALRAQFGSSPNYAYRVILGAVAPMFIIWGAMAGFLRRSPWLLMATSVLLLATLVGKIETLSKAPPAFFLIQLMLAFLLSITNRMTWRSALAAAAALVLVLGLTSRIIIQTDGPYATLEFVYSRVFEAETESLLENFAAFPFMHPFLWGANIRPLAALLGLHYVSANSIAAPLWHGTAAVTIPSLFIADAWADFSYFGVISFSVLAGIVCRLIDLAFLAQGKSVVAIAVLGATFIGILTLLTTALNTAFLSGGLLLAPALAAVVVTASRRVAGYPNA